MYLRNCGSFKSANKKQIWSANSKSAAMSHFRKLCNPAKLFKSANLRIADLRNFFALYTKQFITMLGSVPNRKMFFFLLKLAGLVYSRHKG